MKLLLALFAFLTPAAALAADSVTLDSKVFVEREAQDSAGKPKIVLEPPRVVTPGDRLVFLLAYKNVGAEPASDFAVTNPIPAAVAYAGSEGEPGLVSVDGGKSWGALESLSVTEADGSKRAAGPGDVTHVRWTFAKPIGAGQAGQLSFRGVVK